MKRQLVIGLLIAAGASPGRAQDFWEQTSGPEGGTVNALAGTVGGLVVAGTAGGGVFTSSDDGVSWVPVNEGITTRRILSVIDIPGVILAGSRGGGVFRTTNNGTVWTHSGLGTMFVRSFAHVWPGPAFCSASADGGLWSVYSSENDGEEWVETSFTPGSSEVVLLAFNDSTVLAGSNGEGVFRTTDRGVSWTAASNGLTNLSVQSLLVTFSGRILAGTTGGVFRSTDNGQTWTISSSGLGDSSVVSFIEADNGLHYAGTESGRIYRSFNEGTSWEDLSAGVPASTVASLVEGPLRSVIAGTRTNGIVRTTDEGKEWLPVNDGLVAAEVLSVAFGDDGQAYAGTAGTGLYESTDEGGTWDLKGFAGLYVTAVIERPVSGDLYAGTNNGVYRSTDQGATWELRSSGITDSMVAGLAQTSNGTLFAGAALGFGGGPGGAFRSTDEGANWIPVNNGLQPGVLGLAVDSQDRIYAASSGGLFRSADEGDSWTSLGTGLKAYSVAFNSAGHIFVADETDWNIGAVFRSTDDGASWEWSSPRPAGHTIIYSIVVDEQDVLYAGTWHGLYISYDSGVTWVEESSGMTGANISALAIARDGRLWAGTFGGGTFRSVNPLSSVSNETMYPPDFLLLSSYPNPFNGISHVEIRVSVFGLVRLTIYDLLGRKIETIVDEQLPPGVYRRQWDAGDLPSGVYYYSLTAGGKSVTKKTILLR